MPESISTVELMAGFCLLAFILHSIVELVFRQFQRKS